MKLAMLRYDKRFLVERERGPHVYVWIASVGFIEVRLKVDGEKDHYVNLGRFSVN